MYKIKIFEDYCVEIELADFLNENKISHEQIISISMSSDSNAHERLRENSVNRILLVWDDGIIYKTKKEQAEQQEANLRKIKETQRSFKIAQEELKKIINELNK